MKPLAIILALAATPAGAGAPLPFDVGGAFELVDQTGKVRTDESFHGTPLMIFFGYASCQSICSVALPRMAETVDLLDDIAVTPVLITVDPARDTPEALSEAAPAIHPRLVALTGDEQALAAAMKAFKVESKIVGEDIAGPIYAHGSFIYLMGSDGKLMTLLPPVLAPGKMAEIARGYLESSR